MDGILIVNKPKGITSRDVVNEVSKLLNIKKIGHTGTLDPIATGVLVLCINKATKLIELLVSDDKEYIAEVTLGIETDTLDTDGNIISQVNVNEISNDEIVKVLDKFKGKIKQQVPIYSSVKVNGKKLYEYARNNEEVELPIRDVNINELSLVEGVTHDNNLYKFKIRCLVSKGTYIRSLIRDIGKELGIPAIMSGLVRIKTGNFSIDEAYTIEDIKNSNYEIISMTNALRGYPIIEVNKELETKILNGMKLEKFFEHDIAGIVNSNNELIAIYKQHEKEKGRVKPLKVIKTLDFS